MMIKNLALLAALVGASPLPAEPVDPSGYPELQADALLPPILRELRHTLKDPHSITDFTLCPAYKVKLKDGRPTSWSVLFSFNAKNSYGGYDGVHMFGAAFRDGQLSGGIASTQFETSAGFEGLINGMIAKKMANCPQVPDDRIQQILSGSIYKPG